MNAAARSDGSRTTRVGDHSTISGSGRPDEKEHEDVTTELDRGHCADLERRSA